MKKFFDRLFILFGSSEKEDKPKLEKDNKGRLPVSPDSFIIIRYIRKIIQFRG